MPTTGKKGTVRNRSSTGAKFCDSEVKHILTNPTAKGLHRANYTKSLGDKKNWVLKPKDKWVFNPVEPIVSEELWDFCNHIIEEWGRTRKRPSKKPVQLFAGITYCACGHKMYVPSNTPKYTCSKCRNKIPIVNLEGVYYEQLKHYFTPTDLSAYLSHADDTIKEKEELLQVLLKEEKKVKVEMDHLIDLSLQGSINNESFTKRFHPLEDREKQLEEEIPRLQSEIDFLKINFLASDHILREAKDLYHRWPSLNFDEKRKIVEAITEKIVISSNQVNIDLCYLPSSKILSKEQRNFRDWPPRSA